MQGPSGQALPQGQALRGGHRRVQKGAPGPPELPQDPKGDPGKGEDEHPAVEAAAAVSSDDCVCIMGGDGLLDYWI